MQKKILCVISLLMVVVLGLSAQEKKVHLGITDDDVKNFAKNYEKIDSDLAKFGASATQMALSELTGTTVDKVTEICNKNGISGKNAITKLEMIALYSGIAIGVYEIESNPQTAVQFKMMGLDPFAMYKEMVDQEDYNAVYRNVESLKEVLKKDKK